MDVKDFKYNKEEPVYNFIEDFAICKKCKHKADDVSYKGKIVIDGSTKGICKKYSDCKPESLFKNQKCSLYEPER